MSACRKQPHSHRSFSMSISYNCPISTACKDIKIEIVQQPLKSRRRMNPSLLFPERRSKGWLNRVWKALVPRVLCFDSKDANKWSLAWAPLCINTSFEGHVSYHFLMQRDFFKVWSVSEKISRPLRWKRLQQGESQWYYLLLTSGSLEQQVWLLRWGGEGIYKHFDRMQCLSFLAAWEEEGACHCLWHTLFLERISLM